jgi:hypothetical protein
MLADCHRSVLLHAVSGGFMLGFLIQMLLTVLTVVSILSTNQGSVD